ncbi:MAG: hypothetical protein AB1305_02915 [Candidatus Hadarchaeota archaeon]
MAARNSNVGRKALEEFRRKVRETRAKEWRRDAIRARRCTGEETFEQGLDLIKFAVRMHEASKSAGN